MKKVVSDIWIRRMSRMFTVINYLLKYHDVKKYYISKDLGFLLNIHADVVRKDLNQFGELGTAHRGYSLPFLTKTVAQEFKLSKIHNSCIVGLGKWGNLLLASEGFEQSNCQLVAGFDSDMQVLNTLKASIPLYPIEQLQEVIKKKNIQLACLTTIENSNQTIVDQLIEAGIKAIINYTTAPIKIGVTTKVHLIQIDLEHILTYLAARINLEENHITIID